MLFFHFGQSIWRNAQEHGLHQSFVEDGDIRLQIKMLFALCFVPEDYVIEAFDILSEDCKEELLPLLDYFEDAYIGKLHKRGARREARFPIYIWNMYSRIESNLPRTNNSVEAWHHVFQKSLGCYHPTVNKLIAQFLKEQIKLKLKLLV